MAVVDTITPFLWFADCAEEAMEPLRDDALGAVRKP